MHMYIIYIVYPQALNLGMNHGRPFQKQKQQ